MMASNPFKRSSCICLASFMVAPLCIQTSGRALFFLSHGDEICQPIRPQTVPERPLVASFVSSCLFFIPNMGLTLSISSAGLIGLHALTRTGFAHGRNRCDHGQTPEQSGVTPLFRSSFL